MTQLKVVGNTSKQQRLEDFTAAYIATGGDEVAAYKEAGFSEHSAINNAGKYLEKHHEYVMSQFKRVMGTRATKYISMIEMIAEDDSSKPSEKLKALEMLIKATAINTTDINITTKTASELSPEERKAKIDELATQQGMKLVANEG